MEIIETITDDILNYFKDKNIALDSISSEPNRVNFVNEGLVDSIGIVELVYHLESRYSFTFSPDELESDNFRTVEGLSQIVKGKLDSVQ